MSEAAPVETSATALVHRLTVALRVACLYGPENVVVQESIAALVPTLTGYLARSGKAVVLGEKGLVYVNGRLLRPGTGSSWLSEWNELLERNELGGLFLAGVWDEDAVLELLAGFSEASSKRGGERVARLRDTCRRVVTPAVLELFSPEQAASYAQEQEEGHLPPRPLAAFYYARLVALAEASGQMARLHGNPDLYTRLSQQSVGKLIRHLDERAFEHELLRMTAYPPENDVEANAVHAANVAILAVLMGRLLGLSAAELTDLGFAALEHDLGRSDGGEDDPALHVPMGVALCLRGSGTGSGNRARLIVAREHHGPSDGHPAPEPPHLFSRLVSLADAYDRLETGDDDTPPLSPRAALAALELGERFAPGLIELLRDVVGDAPRGTLLRLPEGGTGLVVEGGARRCRRPLVWELLDPDGMTLDAVRLREVDPDEVVEETERVLDWRTALLRPLPHDLLLAQGTGVDLDSLPTSAMATQAGFGTAGPDAAEVEDAAEAPAEAAAADIDEAAPAKAPAYEVDEGHMLLSDDMTRAYAIGRRLGSGGQGTVYEVFIQGEHAFGSDATQVERAVVKVAHSDFDGLWRERDIYALEVPGLIQMYDSGRTSTDEPYLILERLEPLPSDRFSRNTVDPATCVDVFVNLLEMLRRVHFRRENALILCDIKPDNIMLRMEPSGVPLDDATYLQRLSTGAYLPVLMDAGVAQDRKALERTHGRLETVIGTPLFLAPESCPVILSDRVLPGRYSPRCDVYALTLSLYILLTGARPYDGTGLFQQRGRDFLFTLFDLKQGRVDPINQDAVTAAFEPETAAILLDLLQAGLHPVPDRRASLQTLLRMCRRGFDVEEVEEPGAGLALRQTRLPRPRPGDYGL